MGFASVMMFTVGENLFLSGSRQTTQYSGWIANLNKFVNFYLSQLIRSVNFNERNWEQNEIWEDRNGGLSKSPGCVPKQPLKICDFIGSLISVPD